MFVRYKNGPDPDSDDKYQKYSADEEAIKAKARQAGAKAVERVRASSFGNV